MEHRLLWKVGQRGLGVHVHREEVLLLQHRGAAGAAQAPPQRVDAQRVAGRGTAAALHALGCTQKQEGTGDGPSGTTAAPWQQQLHGSAALCACPAPAQAAPAFAPQPLAPEESHCLRQKASGPARLRRGSRPRASRIQAVQVRSCGRSSSVRNSSATCGAGGTKAARLRGSKAAMQCMQGCALPDNASLHRAHAPPSPRPRAPCCARA